MIGRSGIGLSLLAIISLVTGFATQTLMIGLLGANRVSDSYFIALAIPQFFLTIVAEPVVSVLIPLIAASKPDQQRRRSSVALVLVITASAGSALIAAVTCPLWMGYLFPAFLPSEQALTTELVLIQLLSIAPAAGCLIWKASLYARRRFVTSESVWVGGAVASLVALVVLVPKFGVVAAVWINVARYGLTLIAMIALERVARPDPLRGEFAGQLLRRARPLMVGALYFKSEPLVDSHLSSMSSSGDVTLFSFCRTVMAAGAMVLSQALVTPIIPDLAVLAKDGHWDQLRARMRQRILVMGGLTAAAVLVFALAGLPALRLVASYWPRIATIPLDTFWGLIVLLGGIPIAGGAAQIVTATYYAMGETRLLTIIGAINYTIAIGLKFAGFALGGIWGLAVATTVYFVLDMITQWVMIERCLARNLRDPALAR